MQINCIPLLLSDPSPCLRWLVLRELVGLPNDHPEVEELSQLRMKDPLLLRILANQQTDGSFKNLQLEYPGRGGIILQTSLALTSLGFLGFDHRYSFIQQAANFLFNQQGNEGSWSLSLSSEDEYSGENYSMIPLQTAFPLWGLASCGYAMEPRAERAYEWLLTQRLSEGAWPTGIAAGNYGYVAGYRRLPHSRWGCRSNTTGALICLCLHPQRCFSEPARQALDLLLGRETHEARQVGLEVSRRLGAEPSRGFISFFARFDPGFMLHLCWRTGISKEDPRVADLIAFVKNLQGKYGLWKYLSRPQVSRWITFDLLRSISGIEKSNEWIGIEPRTPFQPYPRRLKNF